MLKGVKKYKESYSKNYFWVMCYCVFLLSYYAVAQEDTIQSYDKFDVVKISDRNQKGQTTFTKEDIDKIVPQDLGHLLQFTAGISMRSYGGIGGLKTISMRGLGAEHTGVIINGLPQQNAQNLQMDFGSHQIDNMEEVAVQVGASTSELLPLSTQITGSAVNITTFENTFTRKPISGRASLLVGSFGQYEGFVAAKSGWDNGFISVSGKYRESQGNYAYRIPVGSQFYEGVRRNNELEEYFIALGGGFRTSINESGKASQTIKWSIQRDVSDKELPGAVIFYNDFADQTLQSEQTRVGVTHTYAQNAFKSSHFVSWNQHQLDYIDPSFLNAEGFLHHHYENNGFAGGINSYYVNNNWHFFSGLELRQDVLKSNRNDFGSPLRRDVKANLGIRKEFNSFQLKTVLFYQGIQDENRSVLHDQMIHRFNPQISFQTNEKWSKNFQVDAWVKKSMRPPSFNELYYSQIGNLALEPEDALQFNLGLNYIKKSKRNAFKLGASAYHNRITNKILALPTQNLFVWSIQNIGSVNVLGADIHAYNHFSWKENWSWASSLTVSYQPVKDVSDELSPTYRNQLAYVPKWSGNWINSIHYKSYALHTTIFALGDRYSLNQNIPANKVAGFLLLDLSASYKLEMKSHELTLHAGIRNVTDENYVFIRSFVMPGRNYFIQLRYEF